MSHVLPLQGSPAREMFDVQQLVDIVEGREPVHCNIWAMRSIARKAFAGNQAVKRIAFIRVRPEDDQLELISFGRRLGWKRHWVFGPVGRRARLI